MCLTLTHHHTKFGTKGWVVQKSGQSLDTQADGHCDSSTSSSSPIQLRYRDEVGRKHWDSGYIKYIF